MRRRKGFTLIELLVVIAVIALLMAILMPTLQRVRRQAKAVACQSNLKQWGTIWATFILDNEGYYPRWRPDEPRPADWPGPWGWWGSSDWWVPYGYWDKDLYDSTEDIRCCPMATKPASPDGRGDPTGGSFLAWGRYWSKQPWEGYGSYGMNHWAYSPYWYWRDLHKNYPKHWMSPHVKGASNIPVHLDSCWPWVWVEDTEPPPERDAIPQAHYSHWHTFCFNRHNGGINSLFMDWSVRKVGLKELWTLKWHRKYNTANRWTLAGGVQPSDWPQWMRKFKDY